MIIPQFFPVEWKENCNVYGEDFTDLVSLGFVIREAGGYSYLLNDDKRIKTYRKGELKKDALVNLAMMKEGVSITIGRPEGATVIWITSSDNFSSVRMLLPNVQETIKKEIGVCFYFTLPSKDLVLIWNTDAPESVTAKHLAEAQEDYENDDYRLTPYGYVYSEE